MGSRLWADEVQTGMVSVGIRYTDLSYVSHQKVPENPTDLTAEIYAAACGLLRELWNGKPIRHLGVHTGRITGRDIGRQLGIFDGIAYEKISEMEHAIDGIRSRFGADALMRAVFLDQPIDHMSGRISREKRFADYDRIAVQ